MQWRRERSVEVEGDGSDANGLASMAVAVRLPAAPALPLDRLGFRDVGEGAGGAANLVSCAPAPHPLFILALCSGGPPTIKGWAPPIRARIKGLIDRWVY